MCAGRPGHRAPARSVTGALLARNRRPVSVAGIDFASPVGVAAGLDKNGVAVRSWAALGFGFAELGTAPASVEEASPEALATMLTEQIALWKPLIEAAGAKAQ